MDKLGQDFTSADPLEKVDLGDGTVPRPTFVNKNLSVEFKADLIKLLKEYIYYFAWEYSEMPGLSRDLVEHRLPIKAGFRPYNNRRGVSILLCMTELRLKLIIYLMLGLFGLVVIDEDIAASDTYTLKSDSSTTWTSFPSRIPETVCTKTDATAT